MITQKELKEWVSYDPETGLFTAIKKSKRRGVSDVCGSPTKAGYLRFNVCGNLYYCHRLVFLYVTGEAPSGEVDHINHIKDDNRWANLRDVTHQQNHKNKTLSKGNKIGCFGVKKPKGENKWVATIYLNGKAKRISSHENIEDAISARKLAEIKYNFHANHGK